MRLDELEAPLYTPEERARLLQAAKSYRLTWDGTCALLGALGDNPDKNTKARQSLAGYHRRKKAKENADGEEQAADATRRTR